MAPIEQSLAKCACVAAVWLALLGAPVPGSRAAWAQQARPYDMMGAGTATCAEFLSDLRQYKGAEEIYFNWALGFMSGSNSELRLSGKPRRNLNSPEVPQEAQAQIIKRMCEANPNQRYLLIIGGLFGNLPVMKDR